MNKLFNVILSSLFICFISIPFILFLALPHKDISSVEKRRLAVFPEIRQDFIKKFDAFYQDHFGLRDLLIKIHNSMLLKFFKKSTSPFVVAGKDGWFFYTGEGVIQDYYGQYKINETSMDNYISIFSDRAEWLRRMGICYLFIPVPNKINIYDEFLPKRIRRIKGDSFYRIFFSAIEKRGLLKNAVYLYNLLYKEKENKQIYFKTDTHWTGDGALLAANEIFRYCNFLFKGNYFDQFLKDDVSHENVHFSGDIAMIMHLEKEIGETVPVVKLNKKNNKYIDKKNATALVLHDSFGNHLKTFLNEKFKKVIYYPNMQIGDVKNIIKKEKPDIVLEVWVARNIQKIKEDEDIKNEILKLQYAESRDTIFSIDSSLDLNKIVARNDIDIHKETEGLSIRSIGIDPFFTVPFIATEKKRYVIEVDIVSPEETDFAIYFTTDNKKEFQQENIVEKKISKGKNRFFIRLPHHNIKGLLRIDLGKTNGVYLLRSLKVKAVEEKFYPCFEKEHCGGD